MPGATHRLVLSAGLAGLLTLGGCAAQPKPLYHWGDYQALIYQMYVKPGQATPAAQVAQLSQDIEQAQASDEKVPPGMHAQLGYMAYLDGKPDMAAAQFADERALYPESRVFMDRLLSTMKAGSQ